MSCPYFNKKEADSEKNDEDSWLTYGKYLKLDQLLNLQCCQSESSSTRLVHEEMLFIITHQTFELWFKQALFEIDSIEEIFETEKIEEQNMLTILSRLDRIIQILKLLNSQFSVLETMTAREFYDFRNYLQDSSGFQSLQFRLLEIKLGVSEEKRILVKGAHYSASFVEKDRQVIAEALRRKSLFHLINDWLKRTPGTEKNGFNFFEKFKSSVNAMHTAMKIKADEANDCKTNRKLLENYESSFTSFQTIFDEKKYEAALSKKERRLSYKAMQGALMIYTYNEEPRFHVPFQILRSLMELDSQFSKFRFSHTCMVQKMIGSGGGTHGSSGYHYLRATCGNRYQVFDDLTRLTSYLIPRERIPPLTKAVERSLLVHNYETSNFDSSFISNLSTTLPSMLNCN